MTGKAWASLNFLQRRAVCNTLTTIVQKLRSIPVPHQARIGGVEGTAAPLVWIQRQDLPIPSFTDEREMNDWLANQLSSRSVDPTLQLALRSASTSDKLVFTHGDLAGRNLIISNKTLVGLVDWEWAGWYPECFERIRVEWEEMVRSSPLSEKIVSVVPDCSEEAKELYLKFTLNMR